MASLHELSESGDELPELPHLNDETLRTRALTHKSWLGAPTNWHHISVEPDNNERLAFLGSHILPHIVSSKLYDPPGPCLTKGDLTVSSRLYLRNC
jgi:dsRNA-specific ribonuclease